MTNILLMISLAINITLSEVEALYFVKEAGFDKALSSIMVCIAKYESAFNTHALNTNNKNGSKDHGLFQINDRWWGKECKVEKLLDPEYNAKCAKKVYDKQGLGAWVAYKKHKKKCDNYVIKATSCPETRIVNNTKREWNSRDDMILETAKNTCKTRYAPNICLTEFRRFDDYKYEAICGRQIND